MTYHITAMRRTPNMSSSPTLAEIGELVGDFKIVDDLYQPPAAEMSVSVETLDADVKESLLDLGSFPLEIRIYNDSDIVFEGPVTGGKLNLEERKFEMRARGALIYCDYMVASSDRSNVGVDPATIILYRLNAHQAINYGNFGIDTSTTGTVGSTISYEELGRNAKTVLDIINDLVSMDACDVYVNPANRKLVVVASRGSDLSNGVFLERGIFEAPIEFSVAPRQVASKIVVIAENIIDTEEDTTFTSTFGYTEMAVSSEAQNTTQTSAEGQKMLGLHAKTLIIPNATFYEVEEATAHSFDVGDTITYSIDTGLGVLTESRRVVQKEIAVSENNVISVRVNFE